MDSSGALPGAGGVAGGSGTSSLIHSFTIARALDRTHVLRATPSRAVPVARGDRQFGPRSLAGASINRSHVPVIGHTRVGGKLPTGRHPNTSSSHIRSSGHKRSAARWGLIHPAALYERGTLVFGRPVWDLITGRSVQSTRPPGPPIRPLPGRSIRSGLRVAAHSFSRRPIVAIGHIDSVEKLRMVFGCRSRRRASVTRKLPEMQKNKDSRTGTYFRPAVFTLGEDSFE